MVRAEEVNSLFNSSFNRLLLAVKAKKANWGSIFSLRRLLYSFMAEVSLVLCCFCTFSAWKPQSQLRFALILVFLYFYQVNQAFCLLAQIWQAIWPFSGKRRRKENISIIFMVDKSLTLLTHTFIQLRALLPF